MTSTASDILKPSLSTTDYTNNPNLSPIEQKILGQYQLMNNTLMQISAELETLTNATTKINAEGDEEGKGVSVQLVENLRQLETKMVFVYTFFKGAVYSILNAQDYTAEQEVDQARTGTEEQQEEEQAEVEEEENVELLGASDNETQNLVT
ncbi:DASH complex subunit DAD2 [Candida viswanathii]|uniref:DASH complex subunit DAD3 n=1 Tax=Candida viswanathii TaxID=5486 RepID=A0A367Y8Q7_9ASCO|nr:DASH complex subunit DAD2 [Candida viswanathii]